MLDLLHKIKIYGFSRSLNYAYREIHNLIRMRFLRGSYSQRGEDLLIENLLNKKRYGFYVDVGAHHPTRFSNTKRFYDAGWSGINIDPNPTLIKKFEERRKRDINLALGVRDKSGSIEFYEFFPSTLSTFSPREARQYKGKGYRLISKNKVPVKTLGSILREYAKGRDIDLLSVDTEGIDLEVLKSNDWKSFKPKVICVETKGNFGKISASLRKHGYLLKHNNGINSIFSVSLT